MIFLVNFIDIYHARYGGLEPPFDKYFGCMNQSWIPSRELNDRILVHTIISACTNTTGIPNIVNINGICIEKQIVVLTSQEYHLL